MTASTPLQSPSPTEDPLDIEHVRRVLVRLEETIIFSLIERAQFCINAVVYEKNAFGDVLAGHSLVGLMLHETEKTHAQLRRYTSPDEYPFFDDLPPPILPSLSFGRVLHPNNVNLNARLREVYEHEIVPFICPPGDDQQYGSSAVNDINSLQALSKRVHYGKVVAESKFRRDPAAFEEAVRRGDADRIATAITDLPVEEAVLARVKRKADTYCRELTPTNPDVPLADAVATIYARWIIPMNKDVQVQYLLQCCAD